MLDNLSEVEVTPMLTTKRMVIGQVVVCSGCCCGAVNRGKPEVPVDWLKREWRARGLLKNIQLSVSGCLGPCDLPNVVRISGPSSEVWLGNFNVAGQYARLVEWADQSRIAGAFLPLPDEFEGLRFNPFSHGAAKC